MRNSKLVLMAAVLPVFLVLDAQAADKTRNTSVATLDTDAAWGGGTLGAAPGAADRAQWNSTALAANNAAESIAAPVTWGGINITAGATANVLIGGASVLTLGDQGITAGRQITLNTPLLLNADQTWTATQQILTGSAATISGTGKLTAAGTSTITLANGAGTFSGGFVLSSGAIVTLPNGTANPVASGGVLTSSALGRGTLTINGGTLNVGTTSVFNQNINLNADFTLRQSFRMSLAGNFDLGGSTRTMSLTRGATPANIVVGGGNNALQIEPYAGGLAMNSFSNGSLRLAASSVVAAGSFCGVRFNGVNGNSFNANSGLVLGDRVVAAFGTSFPWGSNGANPPALTVESTAYVNLGDGTVSRSVQVASLSGTGTVTNLATLAGTGVLVVNGRSSTSTSTFNGVIRNAATFPGANAAAQVGLNKTGDTTQVLAGANTYSGSTTVAGGVLSVGSIDNGGATSSIGAAGTGAGNLYLSGGTLRYTGAATSSDKLFTIRATGGTLESAGTGALNLTNSGAIVSDDPAQRNSIIAVGVTTLSLGADDLVPGMSITGTGIVPGTTIAAVDRYAGIATLSQATDNTATGTSTPVSFSTANRTLNLVGTNADANTLAGSLSNSSGGAVLSVSKSGTGKWVLSGSNTYTGPTTLNAGTLVLSGDAAAPVVSGAGGGVVNGGLLVINYTGTSPKAAIVDDPITGLAANAAGGFQTGRVHTANTPDSTKAIGWLDDGTSTFQTKYTWKGDADLSGTVSSTDFNALVAGYGTTAGGVWGNGDFNYDGKVNTLDFNLLAGNFGAPALGAPLGGAGLGSVVPEPASLSLLAIAALGLARRRRI